MLLELLPFLRVAEFSLRPGKGQFELVDFAAELLLQFAALLGRAVDLLLESDDFELERPPNRHVPLARLHQLQRQLALVGFERLCLEAALVGECALLGKPRFGVGDLGLEHGDAGLLRRLDLDNFMCKVEFLRLQLRGLALVHFLDLCFKLLPLYLSQVVCFIELLS